MKIGLEDGKNIIIENEEERKKVYEILLTPIICDKKIHKNGCISELNRINEFWKSRAKELVNKHVDELYEYFSTLGLV